MSTPQPPKMNPNRPPPGRSKARKPSSAQFDAARARRVPRGPEAKGMKIIRHFTSPGEALESVLKTTVWVEHSASISDESGKVVFEQKGVMAPKGWSALAVNVVASKYFRGAHGSPERENSVGQLVNRVVSAITVFGSDRGYFASSQDAQAFGAELAYALLHQLVAFNSPVWFNVGVPDVPQQASACFIVSVEDKLRDILRLATDEGMIFKGGSGSGVNLSTLRGENELLRGGGVASGPVSWMRGLDSFAGGIKSGGKTRRAAKMVVLRDSHPDVLQFIRCKAIEEKKAWALIEAGFSGEWNVPGGAYASVQFQNANNSVRVTDAFMEAVQNDSDWHTYNVTDGKLNSTYKARALYREIAEAAHICGDPGLQFHDTLQLWHTCSVTGPINASNPCSEFVFLDDTACNLASLRLTNLVTRDSAGNYDTRALVHVAQLTILAQEILVGLSSYPTEKITQNSYDFRPLGLGYADLGALLMREGFAYDSDDGRQFAAEITSLVGGAAAEASALIAGAMGAPFAGYPANCAPMMRVIERHTAAAASCATIARTNLGPEGHARWLAALRAGEAYGFRNAQFTVLAPTGTIGFMLDCDTTGIEPDIALVKYKKMVGGGMVKLVNQGVSAALHPLGYSEAERAAIIDHLMAHDTIEGAPGLADKHLPIFDCAFKPKNGTRSIHWRGHVLMMAAVQPFLSGAISKTVNLPKDATVEDFEDAYRLAWATGVKCVALYRDGSKRTQPLNTGKTEKAPAKAVEPTVLPTPVPAAGKPAASLERELQQLPGARPKRRRLSKERESVTHHFSVGGNEGYLTCGMYDDFTLGEVFIRMSKEGSTISGFADAWATMISIGLQYGVPLAVITAKFSHTRFEPSGFTGYEPLPIAKSIVDYVVRYLELRFGPDGRLRPFGVAHPAPTLPAGTHAAPPTLVAPPPPHVPAPPRPSTHSPTQALPVVAKLTVEAVYENQSDAPPCSNCGSLMVRSGSCYKCGTCGSTSGCS